VFLGGVGGGSVHLLYLMKGETAPFRTYPKKDFNFFSGGVSRRVSSPPRLVEGDLLTPSSG